MKTLNSPEEAKKLADNKNTQLAYQIGQDLTPAGAIDKVTESGKTVVTNRNIVFKWRESQKRFSLRGIGESQAVILPNMKPIENKPVQARNPAMAGEKRGPGRPPKQTAVTASAAVANAKPANDNAQKATSARRGRPPKAKQPEAQASPSTG